jgi:hypothetical protein
MFNNLAAAGTDAKNSWFVQFAHDNSVAVSPSGSQIPQPAASLVSSEAGVSAALKTYTGISGGVQETPDVSKPSVGTQTTHDVLSRGGEGQ